MITLPRGETPSFALAETARGPGWARVGIIKDAGDDPDVTHGAVIQATVTPALPGQGILIRGGQGVGRITKPGLPLPVGEPAINPAPRQMISTAITGLAEQLGCAPDVIVEISVPDGEALAPRTWNPRLGILGGISILGTTGIVVPYSCSAWIHSIQRGIDVARATGLTHVAGCTGHTSDVAVRALHGLTEDAIIDMGDFIGGMLKYLRQHPVPRLTIAGGFAKLSKFAAGAMDLHSKRSQVDLPRLAADLAALGATPDIVARTQAANSALEVLELAQAADLPLGHRIAHQAEAVARAVLAPAAVAVDVLVFDRKGRLVGDSRTPDNR